MKSKEKLLLVWLFLVVAIGVLFNHFWGGAVHALEHFVAYRFASLPYVTRFSGELFVGRFLA